VLLDSDRLSCPQEKDFTKLYVSCYQNNAHFPIFKYFKIKPLIFETELQNAFIKTKNKN
jgi:hypothetical protein